MAAATGTVLAAVLGSLLGSAGTIVGLAIGSMASGTTSWWAERGIRRSAILAQERAEALRARGHHLNTGRNAASARTATTRVDAVRADATRADATRIDRTRVDGTRVDGTRVDGTRADGIWTGPGSPADAETVTFASALPAPTSRVEARSRQRAHSRRRWPLPAAFIAVAFVSAAIVITLIEGAAGKPLSAVMQNKAGHGTTFGGGSVGTSAKVTPSPTPSITGTGATTTQPTGTDSAGTATASPTTSAGVGSSVSPTPTVGQSQSAGTTPSVVPTATTTGR